MSFYGIQEIYPWLYSIYDPLNVYCYVIVGDERALLYDTGYGIGDLPGAVKSVTDKPFDVVLGHGHHDHANGAFLFGEVWLGEGDFELCRANAAPRVRRIALKRMAEWEVAPPEGFDPEGYAGLPAGNVKPLLPGHIFELGGLTAEAVAMEGHTAGSMGLLIREPGVLLCGDAANQGVWMFLPESLSVGAYIAMLERTAKLPFDTFFAGHQNDGKPKSDMQKYRNAARNAAVENSKPLEPLPGMKAYWYEEDGAGIHFSERTLGQ